MLTIAEEVYFGKAKDVVGDLRSEHHWCYLNSDLVLTPAGVPPLTEANRDKATHRDMIKSMKR
jgi:capping protein (actin filament) muscle Z-line, beta